MAFGYVNVPGVSAKELADVKTIADDAKTVADSAIEELAKAQERIAAHVADSEAHPYLRGLITGLDARLALMELMYTTEVSGNPFTVTFETLTGLVCTGVWNQALRRLEF